MSSMTLKLETKRAVEWQRNGFLIFDRFIDDTTLNDLRRAYDEILSGETVAAGDRMLGRITRQVMGPSKAHPTFDANAAVDQGVAIARQLLKTDNVARSYDMLIYKAPGHAHETPWHQDAAYSALPFATPGSPVHEQEIQFWLPLDDVNTQNGCMQFVPGYHTGPVLEHYVASGDPSDDARLLALPNPAQQVDLSKTVIAEIPAGGATIHGAGTPHYTGPNRTTNRPRRSYIFNIAAVTNEA